jgi:hypothetical protein
MLIYIDPSIGKLAREHKLTDEGIQALENLANCRKYGFHIVFSDRRTLESIYESNILSERASTIYRRIFSDLVSQNKIFDLVNVYVCVHSRDNEIKRVDYGGKSRIDVPLSFLDNQARLNRTMLIVEFIRESYIYSRIGEYYISKNKLNGFAISYMPINGGGGTTDQVYGEYQKTGDNFCLCFVDADKKYPGDSIGDTALKVMNIDDSSKPLSYQSIIDAMEIENIVPIEIYEEIVGNDKGRLSFVETIKKLKESTDPRSIFYYDIKKGIKKGDFIFNQNIEYTKFWSSLFREFGVFDASCCKKNGCQKSKQCKEFIAKEWGSTAMPDAIGMLQKKVDTQLARYVSGNHELEWNKIGKLVFDWCCGNTPIPSIG